MKLEKYQTEKIDHICAKYRSKMYYQHNGQKKELRVEYCHICGRTLRNYSWKERDVELISILRNDGSLKYLYPELV